MSGRIFAGEMRAAAFLVAVALVGGVCGAQTLKVRRDAESLPPVERYQKTMADYAAGMMDVKFRITSSVTEQFPDGSSKTHNYKSTNQILKVRTEQGGGTGGTINTRADRTYLYRLQGANTEFFTFRLFVLSWALGHGDDVFGAVRVSGSEAYYRYPLHTGCSSATWKDGKLKLEQICGDYRIVLDAKSAELKRVTYEAANLPVAGPKDVLKAFRFEQGFRRVQLPGAAEPVTVPARVQAIYEFGKETITVESEYEPLLKK